MKDWKVGYAYHSMSRVGYVLFHVCGTEAPPHNRNHSVNKKTYRDYYEGFWCAKMEDQWFCPVCGADAPEEIAFAAELAGVDPINEKREPQSYEKAWIARLNR